MFEQDQVELPIEDRVANSLTTMCLAKLDPDVERGVAYQCTKVKGHAGDHMAHGIFGEVIERWK